MIPKKRNKYIILTILLFVTYFLAKNTELREPKNQSTDEQRILRQFNQWDASHINLSNYIRENLNDRESFEHVKTDFNVYGKDVVVYMKYRAKNMYGAMVLKSVEAVYDYDGNLKKIIKQN